uniref:hypothetical protein n=1 Tax=Klebsiella aerogenes TaxID=548 RepID=UPI0013D5A003
MKHLSTPIVDAFRQLQIERETLLVQFSERSFYHSGESRGFGLLYLEMLIGEISEILAWRVLHVGPKITGGAEITLFISSFKFP